VGPVGPWLPNHLTLAHKLMLAVKKSGIETNVVNGAFPDATNVVLSKLGLEPTSYYTARMDGPYYVKVIVDGEDVSDQWPNEKITRLYQEAGYGVVTQYKSALVDQMRTASSFLKHVLAIYYDTNEVHTCVTGVEGLPGGYPTKLGRSGAKVVLPGISREEAIRINEEGGKIDGIEKIKNDGTVVFCEKNVEYMREVVGYECPELKPSESEERAKELNTLLHKLYDKYNVEA